MQHKHYVTSQRPALIKEVKQAKQIPYEKDMSANIYSCFQLAKMIVTKVNEMETQKRKAILIVDDEPLTFRLIEEYFQDAHLQCDILQAPGGHAAYAIAVTQTPDLIITDWLMPELDGLSLIKQLKLNASTRDIPVIMTTGALMHDEEFNKVRAAGAIDCLQKPLNETEFVAKVKTALALHDTLKEIKKNDESLHTKYQFLNLLMDVAPNPTFITDRWGKIFSCNEHLEQLVVKTKDEILGSLIQKLFPDHKNNSDGNYVSNMEPGMISRFQIEFADQSDKSKNLVLTCISLGGTSVEVIVGSLTDVTEIIQTGRTALLDLEENMEKLQTELDLKHQKLASQAELLIHSRNVKSNFIESVSKLQPYLTQEGRAKFFSLLRQINWELNGEMELKVEKDFDQLHSQFYFSLEKNCPTITKNEKRLCAYLKMNHGASDIARITNKSLNSINVAFARLRTKLQLPSSKDLRSFLQEIAPQNESLYYVNLK